MTIKSVENIQSCDDSKEIITQRVEVAEEAVEDKAFIIRQNEAKNRRKKKKKSDKTLVATTFEDLYKLTGETLGEGSYGKVETCVNIFIGFEYAVKIIEKRPGFYCRSKVLKEIEIYHMCRGHQNIQLIEYFEGSEKFCLVFEKINGGPLLNHIQERICFTEAEASSIIHDLAEAIQYLHNKGMVGSVEYMAPVVVDTFLIDDYDEEDDDFTLSYNKKCDLWSLGVIMYIVLCGYAPFAGHCGSDCGWDQGESCHECQERLFSNIKEGEVNFPDQHWSAISSEAKDLIGRLLVKDSINRLDADQLLSHPWIVQEGSSNSLETPHNLRRQTSIRDLEDFASRAMAVNRAVEEEECFEKITGAKDKMTFPLRIPWKSETWSFDTSPPPSSTPIADLVQKRRKSRVNLWDKQNKFCSINELELESDFFMKAIV